MILDGRGDKFRVVVLLHVTHVHVKPDKWMALCAWHLARLCEHAVSLLHHDAIMLQKRK